MAQRSALSRAPTTPRPAADASAPQPAAMWRVHTLESMPEAAHNGAPPARACHQCGARQDERQEICVECGAAVPRARGVRARLRTAGRPVALAGFATLVVTSAAYGITAQAGRDSSAVKAAVAAAPPAAPA